MKRTPFALITLGLVLGLLLLPARPASAQAGFVRWLEKLSGPGPFVGAGIEIYGLCYGAEKALATDPETVERSSATARWFFDPNCGRAARDQRRLTVGVQLSRLVGDNGLQYDDSVPVKLHDTVGASIFMGTADVGVHRSLDVGSALGFVHFTGAPPGAFSRLMIEPIRVTWKPLAMKPVPANASAAEARAAYRREWLQIRVVMTVLPGGFDAEDFGAIPGSYKSGTEVQGNLYVMANVANLLGW